MFTVCADVIIYRWPQSTVVTVYVINDVASLCTSLSLFPTAITLIARFMGPTWDPSGADRTQVVPMVAPWTFLYGNSFYFTMQPCSVFKRFFIKTVLYEIYKAHPLFEHYHVARFRVSWGKWIMLRQSSTLEIICTRPLYCRIVDGIFF